MDKVIVNSTQDISIIGKVMYVKEGDLEKTKNGKVIQKFNFGVLLNNGASIFIESTLWNMYEPSEYTRLKQMEYFQIAERFNKNKDSVYISARIKKSKDETMFDKLSMYEKQDGSLGISARCSVNLLESKKLENDIELTFKYRDESYTKLFSECDSKFVFNMIVEEKEGKMICLTDGADYPTKIYGELPEDIENKAKIGQGYKFHGELKKGKLIKQSPKQHLWEDEAVEEHKFGMDFMVLRPMGIIKNLKSENIHDIIDVVKKPLKEDFKNDIKEVDFNKEVISEKKSALNSVKKLSKLGDDMDLPF